MLFQETEQDPKYCGRVRRVLTVASSLHGFKLDFVNFDLGGRRYLETGEILPTSVLEELKKVDAIYLGAIGHPDCTAGHS